MNFKKTSYITWLAIVRYNNSYIVFDEFELTDIVSRNVFSTIFVESLLMFWYKMSRVGFENNATYLY